MFDKDTAKPNAHYWVLSLINRNFGPGDKLVMTKASSSQDIEAQAAITKTGRKLLLVNTTEHSIQVNVAGSFSGTKANRLEADVVDQASGEEAPRADSLTGQQITLAPFAVAVVSGANR
jgi:hypothetical protein